VAFRVPDDAAEAEVRSDIASFGRNPTPVIDRFWFRSVYFKEPGGALFEIATDGPGFGVDEPMDSLGDSLVLPPWLEPQRSEIEAALPKVSVPVAS
jgi:glyoxalase family protein